MQLKEHQLDAVKQIHKNFKTNNTQILAHYTGAGKTNSFIQFIKEYQEKNPTHLIGISAYITNEIKEQIAERLVGFGITNAIKCDGFKSFHREAPIYVFNPYTFMHANHDFKFDLLIIDEGHVGLNEDNVMLKKVIKTFCKSDVKILIVTATAWDLVAIPKYKDVPIIKRSMDEGMNDGLIGDTNFIAEAALVSFTENDFTRDGDLKNKVLDVKFKIIKSASIQKFDYLLNKYNKEIGNKCLVICPPGNYGDIARTISDSLDNAEFSISTTGTGTHDNTSFTSDMEKNIEGFINDPNQRFLFVIHKCQTGFDHPKMTSIIDLTMTRNLKLLCQRVGRLSRKYNKDKNYFYIYDQSLVGERIDWIIYSLVDFCMGNWEGWTTRTVRYREIRIPNNYLYARNDLTKIAPIKKVMEALKDKNAYINYDKIKFLSTTRPTHRTLKMAIEESKPYATRTEMWKNNPALYKWFRLYHLQTMNELFPYKLKQQRITEEIAIERLKKCKSRKEYYNSGGLWEWVNRNNKQHLVEKYVPVSKYTAWTHERIVKVISELNSWNELRTKHQGLRCFLVKSKQTQFYKQVYLQMRPKLLEKLNFRQETIITKEAVAKARREMAEYRDKSKAERKLERKKLKEEKNRFKELTIKQLINKANKIIDNSKKENAKIIESAKQRKQKRIANRIAKVLKNSKSNFD